MATTGLTARSLLAWGKGQSLDLLARVFRPPRQRRRSFLLSGNPGRCCTTLTVEDSQRESMRLDGLHEQAIPRPLPHDKLVQLHCLALQARFAVDLAGQGHDLALAA